MNMQLPLTDDRIRAAIARRATSGGDHAALRQRVLAATASVPQRRGWRVRIEQALALPEQRVALTLVIAVLLLLAAAMSMVVVGQMLERTTPARLGRLAYISDGDVYVAGPAGESSRRIWDIPPLGSAYGTGTLAWLDTRTVLLNTGAPYLSQLPMGAYTADVITGKTRLLVAGGYMALSPDRRVVVTKNDDEGPPPQYGVRLIDVASGATVGELPDTFGGFMWSPDGRYIVAETSDEIYRVDVATGERTVLVSGLCCGLSEHTPTWTPDGTRVVYVDYHEAAYNENGGPKPSGDCGFRCGTLWAVPAAGGEPTRLTPELGSETDPAVSPDGRWIAYVEASQGLLIPPEPEPAPVMTHRIVVIAQDGSAPRVLGPDWLHDGPTDLGTVGPEFRWDLDSAGITYLSPVATLWHVTLDGLATRIESPAISEFARQVLP